MRGSYVQRSPLSLCQGLTQKCFLAFCTILVAGPTFAQQGAVAGPAVAEQKAAEDNHEAQLAMPDTPSASPGDIRATGAMLEQLHPGVGTLKRGRIIATTP